MSSRIQYPADPIVETVLNRIRQRADRGMASYGQSLHDARKTPTQWVRDASEEMTDAALYLEKVSQEITVLQHYLNVALSLLAIHSPTDHTHLKEQIPDELLR